MNNFDVMIKEIEETLKKECDSKVLDNQEDVDAVMEVIARVIYKHYNKTLTAAYQYIAHHPV
jgi:hypothetical protein